MADKALHTLDGGFVGWLWREYKDTVSIYFYGKRDKIRIVRGWRKSNIKEYQGL